MVLEQLLELFPAITGRLVTDDAEGDFPSGPSPNFVIGLDGRAFGIELTEVRGVDDGWEYLEEASRLAWQKHDSYERRGLFRYPIALVLHSNAVPLFDIERHLRAGGADEFAGIGFAEVWSVDFSDAYYSAGHPLRPADMFCFKPETWFGFHRIGWWDRKPYG
jgi:hypothetical protein